MFVYIFYRIVLRLLNKCISRVKIYQTWLQKFFDAHESNFFEIKIYCGKPDQKDSWNGLNKQINFFKKKGFILTDLAAWYSWHTIFLFGCVKKHIFSDKIQFDRLGCIESLKLNVLIVKIQFGIHITVKLWKHILQK